MPFLSYILLKFCERRIVKLVKYLFEKVPFKVKILYCFQDESCLITS